MAHRRRRHGGRRANRGTPSWLYKKNSHFRYGTADNRWARVDFESWIKPGVLVVVRGTSLLVWTVTELQEQGRHRMVRIISNTNMMLSHTISLRRFYRQYSKADRCIYAEFGCMRVDMAEHPRGGKHYYCNAHAPFGSVGASTFMGAHGGCWGGECPNWESAKHPDCEGPIPCACAYDSLCGHCFGQARYPAGNGRTHPSVGGKKNVWRACPNTTCPGTLQFTSNIGHRLRLECDTCTMCVTRAHLPVKAYGCYEVVEEEVTTVDGRPYPPAPQVHVVGQRVRVQLEENFGPPAFYTAFNGREGVVEQFDAFHLDEMGRFTSGPAYWVRLDITPSSWPRNPLWVQEKELVATPVAEEP